MNGASKIRDNTLGGRGQTCRGKGKRVNYSGGAADANIGKGCDTINSIDCGGSHRSSIIIATAYRHGN